MLVKVSQIHRAIVEPNADTEFVIKAKLKRHPTTKKLYWEVVPKQLELAGCRHHHWWAKKGSRVLAMNFSSLQPACIYDFGRQSKKV